MKTLYLGILILASIFFWMIIDADIHIHYLEKQIQVMEFNNSLMEKGIH